MLAPSSPPANAHVTRSSSTYVTVTWDPPSLDSQNGLIRAYHLILTDEKSKDRNWTASTMVLSYTFNELEEYHPYILRVSAETISLGPQSLPLMFTTLEDG